MKTALIIVDVQKDYFEGGRCELYRTKEATQVIQRLITKFRNSNQPVIYIQHIEPSTQAPFFAAGTEGIEISQMIKPLASDIIVEKQHPSSFLGTTLQQHLTSLGVKQLVICGMMSHMCIDTTVRAAKDLGYEVTLVEDACTTMDLEWNGEILPATLVHKVYMASLCDVFAKIVKEEQLSHLV